MTCITSIGEKYYSYKQIEYKNYETLYKDSIDNYADNPSESTFQG